MRQVPAKYLIIGRGRLATHLAKYFDLAQIPFAQWHRGLDKSLLQNLIEQSHLVLLAIKDDTIESFIKEHNISAKKAVHFSGTLSTALATRLHPLMTFSKSLYDLADYQKIPFVGEFGSPELKSLIPELDNTYYSIPKGQQDLYHALCVLSGNGTVVLWQQVAKLFEEQLQLPKEVLWPYLERVAKNLSQDSENSLTGPWIRKDLTTIAKNQQSLKNSPLLEIYNSLFNTFSLQSAKRSEETRSIQ